MPRNVFADKHIVLGVTGSIATYKAVALASALVQSGAHVDVIMTESATKMVQPLSFQAITHRPVLTDMFSLMAETDIGHVTLGKIADALLIAPATANTIAKLALGLADNLLTTTALAATCPIIVAPAMETNMWRHPATQANIATLRERGVRIVEPEAGYLASGASGVGRLAAPERILTALRRTLTPQDWAGRRVVVTAGGTREAIDPVRFISNHSSGAMGYAVAEAALDRGADVTLISTARHIPTPEGATLIPVESARDMREAVLNAIQDADALFMAAAVADYRPADVAAQKIKKSDDDLVLRLVRNPDILADVKQVRPARLVVVGWAAETDHLIENARQKLERKGLDLIIANPVPQSFGDGRVQATLISRHGEPRPLEPMPKDALAHLILDAVHMLVQQRNQTG